MFTFKRYSLINDLDEELRKMRKVTTDCFMCITFEISLVQKKKCIILSG